MKIETVKNWWNARKFWEKGAAIGIIYFILFRGLIGKLTFFITLHGNLSIYSVLALLRAEVHFLVLTLFGLLGVKINSIISIAISFFLVVFIEFGLGFKLAEYFKSYILKGAFIGMWVGLMPQIFLILAETSMRGQEPYILFSYAIIAGIYTFVGAIVGLLYSIYTNQKGVGNYGKVK